jgi:hypothetical protein
MMFYFYILSCSIIGFVWSEILTQPGEIFNKLFNQIDRLPLWLSKPLGGCAKCVTGQIALWTYLYYYHSNYSAFIHVSFICQSIFITWMLLKVQERL